jgi:flavin reductase (DIM6/NTAB) family NADH-FMN oxidoreductase RutF
MLPCCFVNSDSMREGDFLTENTRHVVERFLKRCMAYAESSIARKKGRGEDVSSWAAYLEHTSFALAEVEQGRLDAWITEEEIDVEPHRSGQRLGEHPERTDLATLAHQERAALLNAILSPRPLVLVATSDPHGNANIAPMTSMAVVSNSPPLLTMSLSVDRNGRARDTLLNLRSSRRASVYVLLPGPDDAALVHATATPLPHGQSEWDLIPHERDEHGQPTLSQAAARFDVEMVDEHALPDAVATLVVLKVLDAILPAAYDGEAAFHLLCQHGQDRLMASPTGWAQTVHHESS